MLNKISFLIIGICFIGFNLCCSNSKKANVSYYLEFSSWKGMNKSLPTVSNIDNEITLLNLKFINNPYKLDTSYFICLLFNSRPVYSGPFIPNVNISIPTKWINTGSVTIRPGIIIKKDEEYCVIEKSYNDLTWRADSICINSLQFIFLPEMRTLEDRFSISQVKNFNSN